MRGGRCFIVVKVQKEYVKSFVDKKAIKKKENVYSFNWEINFRLVTNILLFSCKK